VEDAVVTVTSVVKDFLDYITSTVRHEGARTVNPQAFKHQISNQSVSLQGQRAALRPEWRKVQ